ncbi:unnamed protein product [Rhizoctonia solani]|uniref:Uncharacterized protein n=1 Tax=Rhizoctonia solani TaxID=456999 RepID=A0A8H3DAP3_9AGAM|nr:unnamed protein product [Rhizoctonia solani]
MFAFSTLAVAASLAAAVAADHGRSLHARSHHHVGRSNLQKRYSGTATYYAVGQGACGQVNVASDFIVALNSPQYGSGYPGPNCFKPITICAKGKCVGATIMDQCPGCAYGSLDLSEGLFKQFASTDDGVFQMTWTFDGEGGDDSKPTTTSTKKPDPTTTKQPEPTTTWKPEPTTTSTWEEPTTTSSKRRTTTSSPPPETTSTHEPTTSSTSWTPTTTSTVVPTTSSSSSSSTSVAVSTSTASTSTSAAPSASALASTSTSASASASPTSTTSSGGSGSGSGSGSNLADAQQVMIALGRMVAAANQ